MAITLGTNIPSYNARSALNKITDNLSKTMEKLSSGLKINRAGDDAAGLVISQNMEALIRGSKQAQANIQNATSFLTIAEDGMVSISDHFQRINDLLVNMANDTNDIDSRTAAVREIIERIEEIDRLADSTNFNGKTMLDGSAKEIIVQMGPDETITSYMDISGALTDCHAKALKADLPANLHPDAVLKDTSTTEYVLKKVKIKDDGTETIEYYEYTDPTKQYTGNVKTDAKGNVVSAFEPNNKNCRDYMDTIQKAITKLSSQRGLLGAYENRMDSAYDSMSIRIESLETAKSHYVDTDIAQEATNLTLEQIKQQYNVALLSNANALPQLALSLLSV